MAIKRMLHGADDSLAAMKREAAVLTAIQHPALPHALDLEVIDGEPFLLMELIRGEPLDGVCRTVDVLRVIRGLTAAIAELHRAGLLHLDLSPGNVLVDQAGECRLIDFGLARRLFDRSDGGKEVPLIGGTPGFVAPEVMASPHGLDRRADIYGIGAVMYFLLTGEPPNPLGDNDFHRHSAVRAGDFRLKAVCRRALAVNPLDRWATAEELLAALDQLVTGPARSRRWLMAATLAASLFMGATREVVRRAQADVFIHRESYTRPLVLAPDVRRGDQVAFAFDCEGSTAGLAIRTPAGRVVPLKPFERTDHGPFRFPPNGTASLRHETGTFVVYFAPLENPVANGEPGLLRALDRLPPPPMLRSGEKVFLIAGQSTDDGLTPEAASTDSTALWRQAIIDCRRRFPGLSVIAFSVD